MRARYPSEMREPLSRGARGTSRGRRRFPRPAPSLARSPRARRRCRHRRRWRARAGRTDRPSAGGPAPRRAAMRMRRAGWRRAGARRRGGCRGSRRRCSRCSGRWWTGATTARRGRAATGSRAGRCRTPIPATARRAAASASGCGAGSSWRRACRPIRSRRRSQPFRRKTKPRGGGLRRSRDRGSGAYFAATTLTISGHLFE